MNALWWLRFTRGACVVLVVANVACVVWNVMRGEWLLSLVNVAAVAVLALSIRSSNRTLREAQA